MFSVLDCIKDVITACVSVDVLTDTFQSSCLLAVVFTVLVHLPDVVLQLHDFSCRVSEQQKQGDMKEI